MHKLNRKEAMVSIFLHIRWMNSIINMFIQGALSKIGGQQNWMKNWRKLLKMKKVEEQDDKDEVSTDIDFPDMLEVDGDEIIEEVIKKVDPRGSLIS
jgi:DNA polymerase-3 subunit alpha